MIPGKGTGSTQSHMKDNRTHINEVDPVDAYFYFSEMD